MKSSVFWVVFAIIVFLSGCKAFEPSAKIPPALQIPDNFSAETNDSEIIKAWWLGFDSPELNTLINNALGNSFDLKALKAKIIQAKARIAKENASFFPGFGFLLGGQNKRTQKKKSSSESSSYTDTNSWDASVTGSYTADVWGETKALKQAQVSNLEAARQDLRAAMLELTMNITEIWIDIIATRNKKTILNNQIKINKTLLELQKLRFMNGKANALDISQQREALAQANSQLPLLEKQARLLLHNLSFLSGKASTNMIKVAANKLPEPLSMPKLGIPSDLIDNRPDIQAAKMRLFSSEWRITAAKADLLPSFKLTAQALFSSGKLDLLFNNWVAALGASIAGPVFDGGLRIAEINRAKAAAEEQLHIYTKIIAKAIFEVEDSLVKIEKQREFINLLEEELNLARLTLKDASLQYQNGQASYLSYLIAWTSIEKLERQLVGEQAMFIKEQVKLYKTLGWGVEIWRE